jgi:hypothetical protein
MGRPINPTRNSALHSLQPWTTGNVTHAVRYGAGDPFNDSPRIIQPSAVLRRALEQDPDLIGLRNETAYLPAVGSVLVELLIEVLQCAVQGPGDGSRAPRVFPPSHGGLPARAVITSAGECQIRVRPLAG